MKSKNLQDEGEKINCAVWNIKYNLLYDKNAEFSNSNVPTTLLPMIIGGDIKLFLAAGQSGYIYFWKDSS